MPAPTVSSFLPAAGGYGATVVLTGTNLTGATLVSFGGTYATSFTVDSSTQITALVPSGATTGAITVTTPGGSGSSSSFTVGTSSGIQAACETFLATDVRAAVDHEQTGLLVSGSVYVSRAPRGGSEPTRQVNAFPIVVEIVKAGPWPSRVVGVGLEEVDAVFDLYVTARRKATADGKAQADLVRDVARAIVRRFRGATNLEITATGATFRRATAEDRRPDELPASGEVVRGVVRVVLTFTEAQASS